MNEQQDRQTKIQKLRELGVEPYPHMFKPTHLAQDVLKQSAEGKSAEEKSIEGQQVVVAGRLMRRRVMGKAAFFHIQDSSAQLQCYIQLKQKPEAVKAQPEATNAKPEAENAKPAVAAIKSTAEASSASTMPSLADIERRAKIFKLLDIGDIVGLRGSVFITQKGETTLRVETLQVLCKALRSLPEKYHGLQDTQLKYRHRHLDLIMNADTRKTFILRSKIIRHVREFLDARGFLEMEVPILQNIYGGAAAQPFTTHHRRLDMALYLKISPELYLKRLIVGGFDKVYDMSKNFRNEGIDRSHNPEFMMLEWYEAYTDYKYQMQQFEHLVSHVAKQVRGSSKIIYQGQELDFTPPWRRLSVREALQQHNLDVQQLAQAEMLERVQGLMRQHKDEKVQAQAPKLSAKTSWGELVMQAFELLVEPTLIQPTFVVDFPLEVSPLTKLCRGDKQAAMDEAAAQDESSPMSPDSTGSTGRSTSSARWVERFEPIVAGFELGNAYTELNDPAEQRRRLEEQERLLQAGLQEAHPMDEDFLHAIEVGLPPTGGVGLGIERLVMLLADQHSIRDVILFPTMKPQK